MRTRDLRKLIGTDTLVDVRANDEIGTPVLNEMKVHSYLPLSGMFYVEGPPGNTWRVFPRDIRLHAPAKKAPEVGSAGSFKPTTMKAAIDLAVEKFGGPACDGKKIFNLANLSHAVCELSGLRGPIDGNVLRIALSAVANVKEESPGSSHFVLEEPAAEQSKPAPTFKVGDVVDCDGSVAFDYRGAKCVGGKIIKTDGSACPYLVTGEWMLRGKQLEGWLQRDGLWCSPDQVRHHVAKEEEKPVKPIIPKGIFCCEEEAKAVPHIVPITANIRDAIEAMKRVKTMAEIEIGRLEGLLK